MTMRGVRFGYQPGAPLVEGFDLEVGPGDAVALMGRSGSGKSTILHLMVGLLSPTAGTIHLEGEALSSLSPDRRADLRLSRCGFVLQFGELIPELSIEENIALPLQLLGRSPRQARARAAERAEQLGISPLLSRRLWEVSGGELQRAAIARAVVHDPALVLADEPTGALDAANGDRVMQILMDLRREGMAVVVVTHDTKVASYCDRLVRLDGRVAAPVPDTVDDR